MAHPLEVSYNWRLPVAIASVAAFGCIVVLAEGRAAGWVPVALLVVLIWAVFVLVMLRRARSYLMVDGSTLVLRPWRAYVRIEGDQVRAVRQVLTPRGPSYKLTVDGPDGKPVRYLAPTAWLGEGHSTFFGWLVSSAPAAELDKGSSRTLEQLRIRGLIR
jgi:hypothetical protein